MTHPTSDSNHSSKPVPSKQSADKTQAGVLKQISFSFLLLAVLAWLFADIEVINTDPWFELSRIGLGLITPDFFATEQLFNSVINTLAFAVVGTIIGNLSGFVLALVFQFKVIKWFCAIIRSIHEIFWALLFLQIFGLSTLTGVLAIAIPFAGIFAKVYAEILEESDKSPLYSIHPKAGFISQFCFGRLPVVWQHFCHYSLYRLECSIRTSAILGFVGLPTLGFHLETAFSQGLYSQAAALLYVFFILIATLRFWAKLKAMPLLLLGAIIYLPSNNVIQFVNVHRFFTEDIIPAPLRSNGFDLPELWNWCWQILSQQAFTGIFNTLILSLIALVATGIVSLLFFPWLSSLFVKRTRRSCWHLLLIVFRTIPELLLAFIVSLFVGPSMLPAIIALSLHNGSIIAYLVGHHAESLKLRIDHVRGINLYFFEVVPRIYGQLLAFLFYRWEVIVRETAILGLLGIPTLGFFIDSAFEDLRFDRALFLIMITSLINLMIDALSRKLRARSKSNHQLESSTRVNPLCQ